MPIAYWQGMVTNIILQYIEVCVLSQNFFKPPSTYLNQELMEFLITLVSHQSFFNFFSSSDSLHDSWEGFFDGEKQKPNLVSTHCLAF